MLDVGGVHSLAAIVACPDKVVALFWKLAVQEMKQAKRTRQFLGRDASPGLTPVSVAVSSR